MGEIVSTTYRLLKRGEIIDRNDETLMDDAETWEKVVPIAIGMNYMCEFLPMRRKLAPARNEHE